MDLNNEHLNCDQNDLNKPPWFCSVGAKNWTRVRFHGMLNFKLRSRSLKSELACSSNGLLNETMIKNDLNGGLSVG